MEYFDRDSTKYFDGIRTENFDGDSTEYRLEQGKALREIAVIAVLQQTRVRRIRERSAFNFHL